MAWRNNHPYLVPMTLTDLEAMVVADDPIIHTSLACPDCSEGRMRLDLEPVPDGPNILSLYPALVCTTCSYATSANHAIYGPRDTTGNRG